MQKLFNPLEADVELRKVDSNGMLLDIAASDRQQVSVEVSEPLQHGYPSIQELRTGAEWAMGLHTISCPRAADRPARRYLPKPVKRRRYRDAFSFALEEVQWFRHGYHRTHSTFWIRD